MTTLSGSNRVRKCTGVGYASELSMYFLKILRGNFGFLAELTVKGTFRLASI